MSVSLICPQEELISTGIMELLRILKKKKVVSLSIIIVKYDEFEVLGPTLEVYLVSM